VLSKSSEKWQQTLVLQAEILPDKRQNDVFGRTLNSLRCTQVSHTLLDTVHHCQIPVFWQKSCLHCSVLQSHDLSAIVASNSAISVFTALNFQCVKPSCGNPNPCTVSGKTERGTQQPAAGMRSNPRLPARPGSYSLPSRGARGPASRRSAWSR